ncbi:nose resistant to fluoxetine protein 6-like [Galendromus occidentalis]|uniref:Nose resistant to fluoxetine protein 6-like n=1 Tax=Galendromus occidentalis TaxID=34638 RepID=A0AAJ6VXD7_9ACAR|nr:nose resistant to fluoxetine protein 6-like [Galendromus occidentalis]
MLLLKSIVLISLWAKYAGCSQSILDVLRQEIDYSTWNEDLEPVLANLTKQMRRQILPYAQEVLYDDEIPQECLQSFLRIASGLNDGKVWAMRFLDSSGGILPGMLDGRLASMGSYDQCLRIRAPEKNDPKKVAFAGQYCTASILMRRQPLLHRTLPSFIQQDPRIWELLGGGDVSYVLDLVEKSPVGYRVGICLPSTCDSSVISHLAKKFVGKYGISADVLGCRDQIKGRPPSTGTVICLVRVARCFSARANYLKITNTTLVPESRSLDCVHGIRALSALWILYAHVFVKDWGNTDSALTVAWMFKSPSGVIINQSLLALETFFALLGFTMYRIIAHVRKQTDMSAWKLALIVILRRAVRFIVTGMGAMAVFYVLPLITSGPSIDYMYPYLEKFCNVRWWSYAIFINNFWTMEEACVENQWYTAADMQIVCILILPICLLTREPGKSIRILLCLVGGSMVYVASLTYYYGAPPIFFLQPERVIATLHLAFHMHTHSLTHLSPAAVGVLGGYLMDKYKDVDLGSTVYRAGWILYSALIIAFGMASCIWNDRGYASVSESVLYAAISRPLWAASLIWLIYMCSCGRARLIRWFLSRPNFIVLSRLSLSFYLMQWPSLWLSMFSTRNPYSASYYQHLREFVADATFIVLGAWCLVLLFEAPATALDSLAFQSARKKGEAKLREEAATKLENMHPIPYRL